MRTFDELVSQLRSAQGAGFDVTAGQAGIVLNRWIKRLAVTSKWIREERELGPSVLNQDLYEIDDDIVDIHELVVAGQPAQRKSIDDLFNLKSGQASLSNGPPWTVFCPRNDAAGDKFVAIYPVPDVAGASLLALCSVAPPDLSGTSRPPFPDDQEDTLLNGCKATFYRELDENPDEGDRFEQLFRDEAERLRRRGNSRVGSGPFRIPSYRDVVR